MKRSDLVETDDRAKLAYALAGKLPLADGLEMIQEMFHVGRTAARKLVARGQFLAAHSEEAV